MAVEVRLFGKLKERAQRLDESGYVGISELSPDGIKTLGDVLASLLLREEEVSHTFLNFEYSDLDAQVGDGDRVSIFPRDMALLYRWYFKGGMKKTYASGKVRKD